LWNVGWQDDLRELDAKLAAGSVSADDYRRARDELLRKAQSGGAPEQPSSGPLPVQQPPSNPFPVQQPPPPPPAEAPKPFSPAPFRWDTPQQPPAQAPTDSTQVIQPVADPRAERTQIVPGVPRDASSDRTQVVRGVGGQDQQQPEWMPHTPQAPPPWAAQQPPPPPGGQPASPWAGGEFDPVVAPDLSWMRPGPESFQEKSTKGRGKILGIVIAAVLVAGLVVAGILFFTSKDDPNNPPQAGNDKTSSAPTTTSKQLPEPPPTKAEPADNAATLIDPPGTARNGGGPFTPESLQTNAILPKPVITAWTEAGLKQGLLKTTTSNGITYALFSAELTNEDSAVKAAKAYDTAQRNGGLRSNADLSLKGVPVFNTPTGDPVYRAVYVVYSRVVIVEVFGTDPPAVLDAFKDLLDKQVNAAPPTQRGTN
jgi:hypothetical protein